MAIDSISCNTVIYIHDDIITNSELIILLDKILDKNIVKKIYFDLYELGTDVAFSLSNFLSNIKSLIFLRVSIPRIDNNTILHLADGLKQNNSIKILEINTDLSIINNDIFQFLKNSKKIKELNLSDCKISATQCINLMNFLEMNHSIKRLKLSDNNINDFGIKSVAELVKKNHNIKQLDISANNLGYQSIVDIATMLDEGNLIYLNLALNEFGRHIEPIFESLQKNKKLEWLNFSNIGPYIPWHKFATVIKNCNLSHLDISRCSIDPSDLEKIMDALSENSKLKTLILANNQINDDVVISICRALEKNNTLTKLNIHNTLVTEIGANHFLDFLATKKNILELDFSYLDNKNYFWYTNSYRGGNKLFDAILRILSSNRKFKTLSDSIDI